MEICDAKILVCTVDAWSEKVGANTMCSLFSWCNPKNLANIYIRPENPTFKGCNHYFQIDESLVIESIIKHSLKTGKNVSQSDQENENKILGKKRLYERFRYFRPWLLLLIREILWKMGNWKSEALKNFLDDFKPDIIVAPYEGYLHFNRIVRYAINRSGANFFGYFWDDNFTYRQRFMNPGYLVYRWFQRRDIRKSVKLSLTNFAITPKTKHEADYIFKINCKILTKPIYNIVKPNFAVLKYKFPLKIVYTGNLGLGRIDTIYEIGKILDTLNNSERKIELHVYSNTTLLEKEKAKLGNSIIMHGQISQGKVFRVQQDADILLFVEAIKGRFSKIARLSFSTKLTDYLGSGKCIMAVARKDIAPIEYLLEHNAALHASNKNELNYCLTQVVSKNEIISEYAKNAWICGNTFHDSVLIITSLKNELMKSV